MACRFSFRRFFFFPFPTLFLADRLSVSARWREKSLLRPLSRSSATESKWRKRAAASVCESEERVCRGVACCQSRTAMPLQRDAPPVDDAFRPVAIHSPEKLSRRSLRKSVTSVRSVSGAFSQQFSLIEETYTQRWPFSLSLSFRCSPGRLSRRSRCHAALNALDAINLTIWAVKINAH